MFDSVLTLLASFSKSARVPVLFAAFAFFIIYNAAPAIRAATDTSKASESATSLLADSQKSSEAVNIQPARSETNSPTLWSQYNVLRSEVNSCSLAKVITEPTVREILAPAANLCINGTQAITDPQFNRPGNQTTGSGVQSPCFGAGNATYDAYNFNLTGCAVFPTEVTITTCGPAGCAPVAVTDTVVHLYRNVAAGDPLTANGGLPNVFDPANPCTNVRAINSNLNGGASSTAGTGNTCNQVNTANCLGACAANNLASGFRRQLGNGTFTVVVSATNTTDTGGYNLYIDAPAAGCSVALAPTAAGTTAGGRVTEANGRGIFRALVVMTDAQGNQRFAYTNQQGYYTFENVPGGQVYVFSAFHRRYMFDQPTQVQFVGEEEDGINFVGTTSGVFRNDIRNIPPKTIE